MNDGIHAHDLTSDQVRGRSTSNVRKRLVRDSGFKRVLENLESPGILSWHFPGLESPEKGHWSWKVQEIC